MLLSCHQRKASVLPLSLLALPLAAYVAAGPSAAFAQGLESAAWSRPDAAGPIIKPDPQSTFRDDFHAEPVRWRALHAFNPAAVVRNGRVHVIFRAEDDTGERKIGGHTSRLGIAVSEDGMHFEVAPEPVFYPSKDAEEPREWPGGVEDPRIVEAGDGTYVMAYTQWNRKIFDVGIATSKDLVHWQKWGPAFYRSHGGKYRNLAYKSAGILTTLQGGRLLAARINGKYLMYWGEGRVGLATSTDLVHWDPVEDKNGQPVVVLSKRPGYFDSELPEVGPPPVLEKDRIVLLYNGKNAETRRDEALPPGTYATGVAVFRADAPEKLLSRSSRPVFKPELPFEQTGQYSAGTTFAEGLVFYQDRWLLYYGCADSLVGVAVSGTRR